MSRRVIPTPPLRKPVPPGLWRATPPAIFPPILGLYALGLCWRVALQGSGLEGLAEMLLGAVTLLHLFALVAWVAKPLRRPSVLDEELRVLPGRTGVTAAVLGLTLLAAVLVPYGPVLAAAVAVLAFVVHLALAAKLLRDWIAGPAEARTITPVWHLHFVGFILLALCAVPLGQEGLARVIFWVMLPVAVAIWGASAWQFARRIPPAPLRPLLAIHLAPASLFAIVLSMLGHAAAAQAFAGLAAVILLVLLAGGRWIVVAGVSPLWGAFSFPLAAVATAFVLVGWTVPGLVVTLAASIAVPIIASHVLRDWTRGSLAQRTNAAVA